MVPVVKTDMPTPIQINWDCPYDISEKKFDTDMADISIFAIFADTICRYGAILADILSISRPKIGLDTASILPPQNIYDTNNFDTGQLRHIYGYDTNMRISVLTTG